jgi:membrane protein involved in colicin uptake
VIPGKEWARITTNLSGFNKDEQRAKMRQQEREALREKSKAMVSNWENTIEGQRLKKLEARKIREEKEEVIFLLYDSAA